MESPLSFSGFFSPKRTKNDVFVLNKVKNGPKRPYNRPKRAKDVWRKDKKLSLLLWLSSSEVLKFMSMLKNEMLIWKSWRREGRQDEGIQISLQPTKIIAILIGFDLVAMFNVSSMYTISWHTLVALADRTNLLRLKLMANSSFRIKKNNHQILQGLSLSNLH